MLPALVALPVALGPLLRGAWDVWAQAILYLIAIPGVTAWLMFRVTVGYLPLPSRRNLTWMCAVLALGAAAAGLSPVHALSTPAWLAFLGALAMFPAMSALSKDERFYVDEAVRFAAWVLMALAAYQRISLHEARPASTFPNANVYAGTILLVLPLALEKGDWLLFLGLLLNLWWEKSVGAWLALFGAILLTRGKLRGAWPSVGLFGGLACLIAVYNKFQSPEVLHRWEWWKTAAAMALDRPLSGYGPGSFAYVFPAYRQGGGLATLYAHQYFLQTAAEYGIVFALVWFAGLWNCLLKEGSFKRFGALAMLLHSLWDWSLSMPANLWLFSYFAASSISEGSRGVNVPSRWKAAVCALLLGTGWFAEKRIWALWSADRAKAFAAEALNAVPAPPAARAAARNAVLLAPTDPEAHLLLASASLREGSLADAAGELERSAALNPFRASTWTELALVYRKLGRAGDAASALQRGARWCARLSPSST